MRRRKKKAVAEEAVVEEAVVAITKTPPLGGVFIKVATTGSSTTASSATASSATASSTTASSTTASSTTASCPFKAPLPPWGGELFRPPTSNGSCGLPLHSTDPRLRPVEAT